VTSASRSDRGSEREVVLRFEVQVLDFGDGRLEFWVEELSLRMAEVCQGARG
jgi:hypothetical protein